jgi:hypothetical protein
MGRRDYSKEGLQTTTNRYNFSNDLTDKINNSQNAVSAGPKEIIASDENEFCQELYEETIDFIRRETAAAWSRRDVDWLKDAEATIRFVTPLHSTRQKWLTPQLINALHETWNGLENSARNISTQKSTTTAAITTVTNTPQEDMLDKWNIAIRKLPMEARKAIGTLIATRKIDPENLHRLLSQSQKESVDLDFTENTLYTTKLQALVDSKPLLKAIDGAMKEKNLSPGTRGEFWSALLLK